ncbi:Rhodanese-like domain-containing protein [Cinnamomum micranthum f. kanehirae]|uniref:Rhodanese-like domain-containing protein n=1 Tax=Cinnamomum micranthum f. kanehirae TaxID=337451 RepID=A0A443PVX8_9MAGN|nr:Rhodanese-like domain-containing protein [Cinnamomum micranthum f. kanehirae]
MAFRTIAAARPPPTLSCAPNLPKPSPPPKPPQLKNPTIALSSVTTPTAISLLTFLSSPQKAKAFTFFSKDEILNALTDAENAIDRATEVGSEVFNASRAIIQTIIEVLKPGVDVAVPVLQKAGSKALEVASPAVSGVVKQAQESLLSAGVDPMPVVSAAKTIAGAAQQTSKVIEEAKPIASTTVNTLLSSDPRTIAVTAGALFLSYLLFPPLWSVVSFNLRGYKGNLSPAQALDLICSQNYLMIDIRPEQDKNKSGIPRLPSSAKNKMISIPLEELPSKIRGLVRNVKKAEAEIVALKISYLKRVNKGSNLVIMDSYSGIAKIVARALTTLGFKNCWIVADGFSGGRGWLQSRLGTDSYNVSLAEVLSPSRVIPAAVGRLGTTAFQSSRKLLPGSADD